MILYYDPETTSATYTDKDGRVHKIDPMQDIEPMPFRTLEPIEKSYSITFKTTGPDLEMLHWSHKKWLEYIHGPDRRVVGRKIRQTRRRMRRLFGDNA